MYLNFTIYHKIIIALSDHVSFVCINAGMFDACLRERERDRCWCDRDNDFGKLCCAW